VRKKAMRILSVDVGVRHLGLCLLEAPDTLLRWSLVAIPGKPIEVHRVLETVTEALAGWEQPDVVIVERQPGKSVVMSRIQNYCEMIGACHLRKPTHLMEPKAKLYWASTTRWWPSNIRLEGKKKWTYRERKGAAITCTANFIRERAPDWVHTFFSAAKRDDLADCLLQALTYAAEHTPQTPSLPADAAEMV